MKVICLNNTNIENQLTVGKVYDVISESETNNYYFLVTDCSLNYHVKKDRFKVYNKIDKLKGWINDK